MTEEPPMNNTELYYGSEQALNEWKRDLKRAQKELKEAVDHIDDINRRIDRMRDYIYKYEAAKRKLLEDFKAGKTHGHQKKL